MKSLRIGFIQLFKKRAIEGLFIANRAFACQFQHEQVGKRPHRQFDPTVGVGTFAADHRPQIISTAGGAPALLAEYGFKSKAGKIVGQTLQPTFDVLA